MTDRVEWFDTQVAAGILATAPHTYSLAFSPGTVVGITVKVPPGPAGNVGFQIWAGGSQYIPRTPGVYIVPDDDRIDWPVTNAIDSGSWALVAYNTDVWPHLLQVGFQVNENSPNYGGSSSTYVSV